MPQTTQTLPAHVGATGVATQHKRLSVAAAATLGALISGGIPTKPENPTGLGGVLYPRAVTLQVEAGGGFTVYYTLDGSTPSAINGLVVPVAPSQLILPYPDLLKNTGAVSATNQQIQLYAGGATPTQAFFEYW
jgi:hypothetical protein